MNLQQSHAVTHGFLSASEFAEALGVSEERVRTWLRRGQLPAVRLGRLILIPANALTLLLERTEGPRVSG